MSKNNTRNSNATAAPAGADSTAEDRSHQHADSAQAETNVAYRCPFCQTTYQDERHVRVHITHADDVDHHNYNGMMPEVEIPVVDDNETVVDRVSKRPAQIDLDSLTIADFPETLSKQHRHILLVAARDQKWSTYRELTECVNDHLADSEIDAPSYSTIRRVVKRFYRLPTQESNPTDESKQPLDACTAKQQAILIARVVYPDKPATRLASLIGCGESYPGQILKGKQHILTQLQADTDQTDTPAQVIRNKLSEDSIRELNERELLTNIPIELHPDNESDPEELPGDQDDHDDTDPAPATWGAPDATHNVMSASPSDIDTTSNGTRDDKTPREDSTTPSASQATDGSATTADNDNPDARMLADQIQQLQSRVRFVRQAFERQPDATTQHITVVALAGQIEASCEEMLQAATQSE